MPLISSQNPKDLVVYLDATKQSSFDALISYAAALAQTWDAHLVVAFVPEDIALNLYAGFARGAAATHMMAAYESRKQESEGAARALLQEVGARLDVSWEFRLCEGERGEALMLHARHCGLAILGSDRLADRQMSALTLSEDVIFASGRPSILLPTDWSGLPTPRKIVIGWNASREAARAISDVMPFLASAEEVHVVVVPEPKISRLLGKEPGADISRHLARFGIAVVLDRLEGADVGELLLSKAAEIDADMLVIGAYGQPKITEFVFGSATQSLLANPVLPVLLSR